MAVNVQIDIPSKKAYQMMNPDSRYFNPAGLADLTGLSTKNLDKAMTMASNKAIAWARTQFVRKLQGQVSSSEQVKITQQMLKKRIHVAKATKDNAAAKMWIGLHDMNLRRFGVGRSMRTGHKVGRRYVEGGFHAQMRNGKEGIFYRLTSDRLPIVEEKVVVKDHSRHIVTHEIMSQAEERLVLELKRAIKALMARRQVA